jgi:hypothetical protein
MLLEAGNHFKLTVDLQKIFPLNLKFEVIGDSLPEFQGPGIFFMHYKSELVYIGYFFSEGDERDARKERMKKEIATISMRSSDVVFSQNAFNAHQQCVSYPIFQGEISDNGFQTSGKRVEFADKNWNSDFIKAFGINSIPRFILIDPNGVVVDADAKRPSNPKLLEQLDGLLK